MTNRSGLTDESLTPEERAEDARRKTLAHLAEAEAKLSPSIRARLDAGTFEEHGTDDFRIDAQGNRHRTGSRRFVPAQYSSNALAIKRDTERLQERLLDATEKGDSVKARSLMRQIELKELAMEIEDARIEREANKEQAALDAADLDTEMELSFQDERVNLSLLNQRRAKYGLAPVNEVSETQRQQLDAIRAKRSESGEAE